MSAVRSAAGSQVRIIGMSYYVPQLQQWRDGVVGQAQARAAEEVVQDYNGMLAGVYKRYGAPVADVFGAFHSPDFTGSATVAGMGTFPPNVADICRWTWECAPPPRGPNVHANTAGYQVIAQAFLQADG
jgi:lysophospholipase L1-like esterase